MTNGNQERSSDVVVGWVGDLSGPPRRYDDLEALLRSVDRNERGHGAWYGEAKASPQRAGVCLLLTRPPDGWRLTLTYNDDALPVEESGVTRAEQEAWARTVATVLEHITGEELEVGEPAKQPGLGYLRPIYRGGPNPELCPSCGGRGVVDPVTGVR